MPRKTPSAHLADSFARYPTVHQWIPYYTIWYRHDGDEWYIHSPRATYEQLVQSREGATLAQTRAKKRGHLRAYQQHLERREMLDRVLEVFGALMAQHPTLTLAEACRDPLPQGVQRVLDRPATVPGSAHPLRRVREL